MDAVCRSLETILKERALSVLFQPIIALEPQHVYGFEGLIRGPANSEQHAPIMLFANALQQNLLLELECLAQEMVLKKFAKQGLQGRVFLNVSPLPLQHPHGMQGQTLRLVQASGLRPEQVVIELTETIPLHDERLWHHALAYYRDQGFAVALDALGSGYPSVRLWSELRPEYVKMDLHVVQNIQQDEAKRQFLRAMHEIASSLETQLIVEGVEVMAEYDVIKGLNIPFAQGHYFARPAKKPVTHLKAIAGEHSQSPQTHQPQRSLGETAASLLRDNETIHPDLTLKETIEFFQRYPKLHCLPVLLNQQPVGIVRRNELFMLYARRFTRELHDRRPIRFFMQMDVLITSEDEPLESLSHAITSSRQDGIIEDFMIVDQAGRFLGIGLLVDLLQTITALQIRYARYANPLTQLPGNVPINEYLNQMLQKSCEFAVAYCDLDHFKPFNDYYGYARGDEVIRSLGTLLQAAIRHEHDFVGHVGGDDFVWVLGGTDWETRCAQLLKAFAAMAPGFYDESERQAGGLSATDRLGQQHFFPLLSLSIGVTSVTPGQFQSHLDISKRASEVKHLAKQEAGNSLFIDRRGQDPVTLCWAEGLSTMPSANEAS
ncbi:bifunctional diguanylate cyclase/phosphodiesterase [Thiorhodospira sibirica]|uniref:bifunctional diguanylate cyclase/phosphodiesterase n=1 Tax=Thiorhodospira sibirica TaxID=154347 RepID=UPI00022C2885|nr:bifunctional diguanylate cyclase/phosphodiesterase [Thiorhodospira sibirica]